MFRKTLFSFRYQSWLLGGLVLILFLGACTSPTVPLQITSVTVSPEPVVGQIVTLEITIQADNDEADVSFTADTLESAGNKIHLVGGDSAWQGSLAAGQPQTLSVSVCVIEEGSWPVELNVLARHTDGSVWHDFDIIHLDSTLESGELIPSSEYTFSQEEFARRPTPRPFLVSTECSGQKEAVMS